MQTNTELQETEKSGSKTVHVTVRHTQTATKKEFTAHLDETLQKVINEAYKKLGETPRPGDEYFCHDGSPRLDLKPYLGFTLEYLLTHHICVYSDHGKFVCAIDIDADTGGAVR